MAVGGSAQGVAALTLRLRRGNAPAVPATSMRQLTTGLMTYKRSRAVSRARVDSPSGAPKLAALHRRGDSSATGSRQTSWRRLRLKRPGDNGSPKC